MLALAPASAVTASRVPRAPFVSVRPCWLVVPASWTVRFETTERAPLIASAGCAGSPGTIFVLGPAPEMRTGEPETFAKGPA